MSSAKTSNLYDYVCWFVLSKQGTENVADMNETHKVGSPKTEEKRRDANINNTRVGFR